MTGKIVIRASPTMPLSARQSPPPNPTPEKLRRKKSSSNVGEVAGGTAANCVVVSCCCPCVLFEFLILAVYKVPANLCRRMLNKNRQKGKKKNKKRLLEEAKRKEKVQEEGESSGVGEVYGKGGCYVDEVSDVDWKEVEMIKVSVDGSALELDKQMWDRFNNTGFWRSPSQRFEYLHHHHHDHDHDLNNGSTSIHDDQS